MEDVEDDMDFCMKLAAEENLVLLPGKTNTYKKRMQMSTQEMKLESVVVFNFSCFFQEWLWD